MQKLQETSTAKGVVWDLGQLRRLRQGPLHQPGKGRPAHRRKEGRAHRRGPDPDGTVGHAFGAKSTPTVAVTDPAGKLIYFGTSMTTTPATPRTP
ncbi:MAG: hypothetical protein U1G05_01595 [Kiritimatiellia bacterium]